MRERILEVYPREWAHSLGLKKKIQAHKLAIYFRHEAKKNSFFHKKNRAAVAHEKVWISMASGYSRTDGRISPKPQEDCFPYTAGSYGFLARSFA